MATKTENLILEFLQIIKTDVNDVKSKVLVIESEMKHKVDDITFVNDMTVFRKKMNDEVDNKIKCKETAGVNWGKVKVNCIYLSVIGGAISAPIVAVLTI